MVKRKPDEEDEAFPRGKPSGPSGTSVAGAASPAPAATVKQAGEAATAAAPGKKKRRQAVPKTEAAADEGQEAAGAALPFDTVASPQAVRFAPRLRPVDLTEGTLLMAAVREATNEELTLSLPYNLIGFVSLAQAVEQSAASEPLPKLSQIYSIGQLVLAVVTSVVEVSEKRQRIELSLRPTLANAGLDGESLAAGMWLPAVVQDEEEHVLRLGFGIAGLQGLLKKGELPEGMMAKPGCILQVWVVSANVSAGTVRCSMKMGQSLGNAPLKLEALKAGFLVHTRIDKVLTAKGAQEGENIGLVATFCGSLVGIIHCHHQGPNPIKYKQRLSARVLAVVPGQTTVVHLTLLPHLLDWTSHATALHSVGIGDRLDGEVVDFVARFGVRFRCSPRAEPGKKSKKSAAQIAGFCPMPRLADKEQEKAAEALDIGSSLECRVLGYNYLEGALILTRRAYDLQEDTLVSLTELSPGQLVVGTVSRITEFGVFVKLSEYVSGLVHLRHLTDVPLASVSKRIQVDSKLKCRVLRITPEKRQLSLTAKKSLVKDDFQFTAFEQARRDMLVTGFVSNVQSYGAIVTFYDQMFGLLPAKEMELDEAPALGMAVKVRITNVNRKRQRLALSLDLASGKSPEELGATPSAGSGARPRHGAFPGQIVSELEAVRCTQDGVLVRFKGPPAKKSEDEEAGAEQKDVFMRGFIPKGHLSDEAEVAEKRHKKLAKQLGGIKDFDKASDDSEVTGVKVEDEGVVLSRRFNPAGIEKDAEVDKDEKEDEKDEKKKHIPLIALLSLKPSMHSAAQDGSFVTEFEGLEESRFYAGYIKDVRDFGALVSVGAWRLSGLANKGQLTDHFVEKPEEEVTVGQSVRVLIAKLDTERKRFKADLRPEGSAKNEPAVLRKEVGAPVKMTVQSIRGLDIICSAKGGIRGHVHVTQLVDIDSLEAGKGLEPLETIETKSMIDARIMQVPKSSESTEGAKNKITHLELTSRPSLMKDGLPASDYEAAAVRWKTIKKGAQVAAAVAEVRKGILWMEVAGGLRGRVVPLDASTDLTVLNSLPEHYQVGQVYKAHVLHSSSAKKQLDLSLLGADSTSVLCKGAKVLARLEKVEGVTGKGVAAFFQLPGRARGFVHITELFDFWAQHPRKRLQPKTFYEVSVLTPADPDAGDNARVELSIRASAVFGRKEAAEEKRPMKADELQVGQKVSGYVVNANDKGVFVALSRTLTGRIRLKALSERVIQRDAVAKLHPPGELIKDATVVEIDAESGRVELSLRKGGDCDILTIEQISVGDIVTGRVKKVEKYGLFVRLDGSSVDGLVHISEVSDNASVSLDSYKVGDRIQRAKVLKMEGTKVWFGIKPSLFDGEMEDEEDEDDEDEDEDVEMEAVEEKPKSKTQNTPEKTKKSAAKKSAKAEETEEPAASGKKRKNAPVPLEKLGADSDDEAPWQRAAAVAGLTGKQASADGEASFVFADFKASVESSDEDEGQDDEDDEDDKAGKSKLSKRQKKAAKATAADDVRKREAEVAEGRLANDPRSVEDFERLLLTEGDTSIVWIRYMAFHLKMSDLEKARQVAERAVKHVGFSEAQERFNAWVAYMNLECTFGAEETADALFKRAAAHNDARQVHMQLARIHERNKKPELATKVYDTVCKKFAQSKSVWLAFLTFLYQQGDLEGARKTLPKCLAALPRIKHPEVVSRAALLEYNHGAAERGRSIFEGLLDSYPKRTDLWSVYMDAHIKAHTPPKVTEPDLKEVRSLMERCCTLSLKAVKMRFFFKRWLDFEKHWGDEESQEQVRAKARAFVESQAS